MAGTRESDEDAERAEIALLRSEIHGMWGLGIDATIMVADAFEVHPPQG